MIQALKYLGVPVIFRSDCDLMAAAAVAAVVVSECQSFLGQTATQTISEIHRQVELGVPVIFRSDCDVGGRPAEIERGLGVPVIFRSDCDARCEVAQRLPPPRSASHF